MSEGGACHFAHNLMISTECLITVDITFGMVTSNKVTTYLIRDNTTSAFHHHAQVNICFVLFAMHRSFTQFYINILKSVDTPHYILHCPGVYENSAFTFFGFSCTVFALKENSIDKSFGVFCS